MFAKDSFDALKIL